MTNNTDADIRAEFEKWSAGANCFTPELKLEMAFRYALALGIEQGKRIENEECAILLESFFNDCPKTQSCGETLLAIACRIRARITHDR